MIQSNTYIKISENNPIREELKKGIEVFGKTDPDKLIYCLSSPLIGEDEYEYGYEGVLLLSPKNKLIFIGYDDSPEFQDYIDDFIADIGSLSQNYNYQKHIKRPREWRERIVISANFKSGEKINIGALLNAPENAVSFQDHRLVKYIISLVTGCINDIKGGTELIADSNLLDEVKNKIILFDADQTRFLYNDYYIKKLISVQGLSGTGKTELLLHKLREIFSKLQDDQRTKVFFTCHNIALANELRKRIPEFFNRMKISRQIEWNNELWVANAWGGRWDPNTGLYAFLCHFYNLPFYNFRQGGGYSFIFQELKRRLDKLKNFKPCLDYILIDENQDFPEVFFDVCKKVVRYKVYTAGDVFQNIFYQKHERPKGVDIFLRRCYRTDPRTLMFAHALGLGLKEDRKFNWFSTEEWDSFGYEPIRNNDKNTLTLKRLPLQRFEKTEPEKSVELREGTNVDNVIGIINEIKEKYPNVSPGDIAIIVIDDDKEIYPYMDRLSMVIRERLNWEILRGHEEKKTDPNRLYLTNTNNVKGLEFPFVICVTAAILSEPTYRNKIYTMVTRSFIATYLLIREKQQVELLQNLYNNIAADGCIRDIKIPTDEEVREIRQNLIAAEKEKPISWEDMMGKIFDKLEISDIEQQAKIKKGVLSTNIDKFDVEKVTQYITVMRENDWL